VARGVLTEATLEELHRHMSAVVEAGGAKIDAYYYCPHHPDGTVEGYGRRCECRKPAPGLVDRAARELGLDPARSFVVGDKWIDVRLARAVGARALLVRTGYGAGEERRPQVDLSADRIVDNLIDAVSDILLHQQSSISNPQSSMQRC
jgi:D-glycero-D-manno-heptose 1,7-bisphosphate phosphatase